MNDPPLSYRFRTIELQGQIDVNENLVLVRLQNSFFSRFEFATPLNKLNPHPFWTSKVPSVCWGCLVIGLLAIFMIVVGMTDGTFEEIFGGIWYYAVLGVGAVVMLSLAIWFRQEHWVHFTGKDGTFGVWYCRGRTDRESFDAFTEELTRRIEEAQ